MGTNYYLHTDVCSHCGRAGEVLHIGKSSSGWCFSLHVDPERNLNDLEDWVREWDKPNAKIFDEYQKELSPHEMTQIITVRGRDEPREKKPHGYASWSEFHLRNFSQRGPNGLLRHKLANNCVKHGTGTWDCCAGEFS